MWGVEHSTPDKFYNLFYCACANELLVNNGNRGEIMEKLRSLVWSGLSYKNKDEQLQVESMSH